jgi:diguanylate cyclase (GGDEF)-like protein
MKKALPGRPTHFFFAAVMLVAAILVIDLGFTLLVPGPGTRSSFADILSPLADLLAVAALFLTARKLAQQSRSLAASWGMLCLATLFYALGDLSWAVLELVLNEPPFPSIADLFYLLYYPLLLIGVILLPSEPGSRAERVNTLLDSSIVLIASLLGFYNLLVAPILHSNTGYPAVQQAILVAYPVGDMVLFAALILIINYRSHRLAPLAAILMAASLIFTILTDGIYSYQTVAGTYRTGGLLDMGWVLQSLLMGLAAVAQYTAFGASAGSRSMGDWFGYADRLRFVRQYLPYAWLAGAFLLLIRGAMVPLPMSFPWLASGVGAIIALVLLRQLLTLAENDKLNKELEKSVENFQVQATKLERINQALNSEISERKRVEERLSFDSLHDSMTKLANRVLFMDRLGQALEYCKRRSDYSFAVLFVDLDQFKIINDSLGHITGDQLLMAASRRLKGCLRSSDTVARFGGDEFAILVELTGDQHFAATVARKILDLIEQPFNINGHVLYISASIGIVASLAGYERPEDVLRDADIAMYQAKSAGKARYEIFDVKMRSQAFSRLEVERELRMALEHGEFRLHFQPIISLENGRVASFEALLRWLHPARGLLLPVQFLSIAEESSLILPIGNWVMYEACSQLSRWHREFPQMQGMSMNVNISNKQFLQPGFVNDVIETLHQTELRPEFLKLEITENVLISNYSEATQVFNELQSMGVQLEIDDFGNGYSALGYLQHLPINTIKIDKSFIDEIGKEGRGTELIRAIVSMARELNMDTIAEGIETRDQLNALKGLLCGFGQGYYLSRPMDEKAVQAFLESQGQIMVQGTLPNTDLGSLRQAKPLKIQ